MRDLSKSAWKTSWRSLLDAFGATTKFPVAYLALVALNAAQQYYISGVTPQLNSVEQILSVDAAINLFGVSIAIAVVAMVFWIPMLRYFADADENHPYGVQAPYFRIIGWWLGLTVV